MLSAVHYGVGMRGTGLHLATQILENKIWIGLLKDNFILYFHLIQLITGMQSVSK